MCILQLLLIVSFVYWHYVNTETIRCSKLITLICINIGCYLCIFLQTPFICIGSGQVRSRQVTSGRVWSGRVGSGLVGSGRVRWCGVRWVGVGWVRVGAGRVG